MSFKKHHVWVMMPVLGILMLSPRELERKYGRHIASDTDGAQTQVQQVAQQAPASTGPQVQVQVQQQAQQVTVSRTPKLDELLTNVDIPARQNPVNLNADMLREDISSLLSRVSRAEEFDKNTVQKPALDHLKNEIKTSAIELRQVENSIKDLVDPSDEGDIRPRINEARIRLEASLKDLEEVEAFVATRPAQPATPAQVATSTPAPDRAPSVVEEETTAETPAQPSTPSTPATSSTPSTEKDPILCALEEQNKLLQQQLQTFVQQQSMIVQQMMQMTQMMLMQNMYRTPDTFNYQQMYQYQPQVAGNWVYYPNGFQPIQPGQTQVPMPQSQQPDQNNIFGVQPYGQIPQAPMMGGYGTGMYGMQSPQFPFQQPQMMNQGGQWGLAPQSFNHTPGNFGMEALGFNFSGPQMSPPVQNSFVPAGQWI